MAFFIVYFYNMPVMYSFVIPVYNRPEEIRELLHSIEALNGSIPFEVVMVDDGSERKSDKVALLFPSLNINYYYTENTGPGDSRNFGMRQANGDYFIILDSDCLLSPDYLISVHRSLQESFIDCFGGPDTAHSSFNFRQKAISFVMTSFLTTGGVRGGQKALKRFEPRSFNMGLSRSAFEKSGGFGDLHPGEDPELVHRLWDLGFDSTLINDALVYHKRRLTWSSYTRQIYKFGLARSILNRQNPNYSSIIFWLPTLIMVMAIIAFFLLYYGWPYLLIAGGSYLFLLTVVALVQLSDIRALYMIPLIFAIQNMAYSAGFLNGWWALSVFKKAPRKRFSNMFFKWDDDEDGKS